MDKKELRKANGDVFFEASRLAGNSYILANWVGIQSLETIMMGAGLLTQMLRELPCPAILNSNYELIGPWDDGAVFLSSQWLPKARSLGLQDFAHVISPGIFGRRSYAIFEPIATQFVRLKSFAKEEEAASWLVQDSKI